MAASPRKGQHSHRARAVVPRDGIHGSPVSCANQRCLYSRRRSHTWACTPRRPCKCRSMWKRVRHVAVRDNLPRQFWLVTNLRCQVAESQVAWCTQLPQLGCGWLSSTAREVADTVYLSAVGWLSQAIMVTSVDNSERAEPASPARRRHVVL